MMYGMYEMVEVETWKWLLVCGAGLVACGIALWNLKRCERLEKKIKEKKEGDG